MIVPPDNGTNLKIMKLTGITGRANNTRVDGNGVTGNDSVVIAQEVNKYLISVQSGQTDDQLLTMYSCL